MAEYEYWQKQGLRPLFGEIDMERPEQKRLAGKMLIVGGNKGAFFAVASAMNEAEKLGVGEVRVLLPASLRGHVPTAPEVYFAEAEASGAFGKRALPMLFEQAAWADVVVLIGDMGKNAETSVALAELIQKCEKPIFVTRDAVEVVTPDVMNWGVLREQETVLLLTLPQLQKLLRTLYYPKIITLSMPTNQLIETLHKFTISYPQMGLATYHNEQVIVAAGGAVISEALHDTNFTPISLWDGMLMVRMATLRLWNAAADLQKPLATAILM